MKGLLSDKAIKIICLWQLFSVLRHVFTGLQLIEYSGETQTVFVL